MIITGNKLTSVASRQHIGKSLVHVHTSLDSFSCTISLHRHACYFQQFLFCIADILKIVVVVNFSISRLKRGYVLIGTDDDGGPVFPAVKSERFFFRIEFFECKVFGHQPVGNISKIKCMQFFIGISIQDLIARINSKVGFTFQFNILVPYIFTFFVGKDIGSFSCYIHYTFCGGLCQRKAAFHRFIPYFFTVFIHPRKNSFVIFCFLDRQYAIFSKSYFGNIAQLAVFLPLHITACIHQVDASFVINNIVITHRGDAIQFIPHFNGLFQQAFAIGST